MTFGVGLVFDPASAARPCVAQLAMMEEALEPVDTGRRYLNFTEETTDPARFFEPAALARLQMVKARVDPNQVIRANHPIRPSLTPPADRHTVGRRPAQARPKPAPAFASRL